MQMIQADIDNAVAFDQYNDPICNCLKRYGFIQPYVNTFEIGYKENGHLVKLSMLSLRDRNKIRQFIYRFDNGFAVELISFTLEQE